MVKADVSTESIKETVVKESWAYNKKNGKGLISNVLSQLCCLVSVSLLKAYKNPGRDRQKMYTSSMQKIASKDRPVSKPVRYFLNFD